MLFFYLTHFQYLFEPSLEVLLFFNIHPLLPFFPNSSGYYVFRPLIAVKEGGLANILFSFLFPNRNSDAETLRMQLNFSLSFPKLPPVPSVAPCFHGSRRARRNNPQTDTHQVPASVVSWKMGCEFTSPTTREARWYFLLYFCSFLFYLAPRLLI